MEIFYDFILLFFYLVFHKTGHTICTEHLSSPCGTLVRPSEPNVYSPEYYDSESWFLIHQDVYHDLFVCS